MVTHSEWSDGEGGPWLTSASFLGDKGRFGGSSSVSVENRIDFHKGIMSGGINKQLVELQKDGAYTVYKA